MVQESPQKRVSTALIEPFDPYLQGYALSQKTNFCEVRMHAL